MRFAAIDIGSNAIRFQVSQVIDNESSLNLKKLEYMRFPLRLGHDVFTHKRILPNSKDKFIQLMRAFKILMELYEVHDYIACATSAMREAENGQALTDQVNAQLEGFKIHIIDGIAEAELINMIIQQKLSIGNYLHIDVGGGSTELNIFQNAQNISAKSFELGSVRRLKKEDGPEQWTAMKKWIGKNIKPYKNDIIAIGTGGNINKIYDIAQIKSVKPISYNKIEKVKSEIEKLTIAQRMNILQLNADRADVIALAGEIYLSAMKWAGCKEMIVPGVGLKDGLLLYLYRKHFLPSWKPFLALSV